MKMGKLGENILTSYKYVWSYCINCTQVIGIHHNLYHHSLSHRQNAKLH